ncbi:MAG: hypothetical protein HN427_03215 [Flavobacteriales bacterium]|jgi:hypothetical protein|nr:hypothetical protein [Flavobacteriales bacterium]MBT5858723.1 hypothetical protein [Flavobacteriales bacterium]MBT6808050.1 hypothetical protein [Flavobacteriales bacterium]MBT7481398.1 hypothetical protein [Flavobacteriales bacterium]MBT7727005.1 hypothetical protein [Flavobacteriales bacterium]
MKTQKILAGIGIVSIITAVVLTITSFTPKTTDFISRETSRDGITVYSYGDYIIVKTDNSVSVSK